MKQSEGQSVTEKEYRSFYSTSTRNMFTYMTVPMVEHLRAVLRIIIRSATSSILFLRYLEEATDPVWVCHGKLS